MNYPMLIVLLAAFNIRCSSPLYDQLVDWLLRLPSSSCQTIVLVAGANYWASDGLARFLQSNPKPVILFDNTNGMHAANLEVRDQKFCSELIVLDDIADELARLVDLIHSRMPIRRTFIVSSCSLKEAVDVLRMIKDERVTLVTKKAANKYQMLVWRINDQVDREPLTPNASLNPTNNKRLSLMGRHLTVATLDYPPFSNIIQNRDGAVVSIKGIEPEIIKILASSLNFSFSYVLAAPDELWGEILDNGTRLTGLVGMLWRREVDIADGALYIEAYLLPFIDFTVAYKTSYECFLVPAPQPYPEWTAVYFPFTPIVWTVTTLATVGSILTVYLLARGSATFSTRDSGFRDLGLCVVYLIGNLLQVRQFREITRLPNRVFFFSWFVFIIVVPVFYKDEMISRMTVPASPRPINTLKELIEQPIGKTSFANNFKNLLLSSPNALQRQLGDQLVVNHNLTWSFSQLDTGDMCVGSGLENLQYVAATKFRPDAEGVERVHIMKECMMPSRIAFGVQRQSPVKYYLDKQILRLAQAGFVDYQESILRRRQSRTSCEKKLNAKRLQPFSVYHLEGAFLLYGIGIGLGLVCFVWENLRHRIHLTLNNQINQSPIRQ